MQAFQELQNKLIMNSEREHHGQHQDPSLTPSEVYEGTFGKFKQQAE